MTNEGIICAREIDRWASSFEYQDILAKRNEDNGKQDNIQARWRNW